MVNALRYLRSSLRLVIDYTKDLVRFSVYNTSILPENNKRKLGAIMVRTAHGLEKAFTLPEVRLGFGQSNCQILADRCDAYISKYGVDDIVCNVVGVLNYYRQYHHIHAFALEAPLIEKIDRLSRLVKNVPVKTGHWGGAKTVEKCEVASVIRSVDFDAFVRSRSSVRTFAPGLVSHSDLKAAVDIAMKSPSVCNRRAWRVNVYRGDRLRQILALQNGNSGFGHLLEQAVLVVGVLSSYSNQERNQVYIDGGLFSMSLLYALHSQGFGTCPLNTSFSLSSADKFRQASGLEPDEVPIMIIAFGNLRERYQVAVSARADPDNIIRFIE